MTPFLLFFVALATASPVRRQQSAGLLDLNGDGRLSKAEVLSSMTLEQAMLALDYDGDGFFSPIQVYTLSGDFQLYLLLDTDSDGQISFDEVRAGTNMARIFDRDDRNLDGYLDGPEADKMVYVYMEVVARGLQFWARDRLDADQDRKLSKQEVLDVVTLDKAYAAVDDDFDGHFTEQEITDTFDSTTFQTMDANADGRISFGEFHFVMDMGGVFDYFDKDATGFLEGVEQYNVMGIYTLILNMEDAHLTDPALDTDRDGRLSKPEVEAAMTLDQIMFANDDDGDRRFTLIDLLNYFDRDFFARFDADADGFVTFDEMRAVITVGSFFDYCDSDGNGFLEKLEQRKVVALYYTVQQYLQANGNN